MGYPPVPDWRWWRERRPPAEPIHLDTAAAGRSSLGTLAATAAHAEREATTGAYVAQEEAEPVLAEGRARLAWQAPYPFRRRARPSRMTSRPLPNLVSRTSAGSGSGAA